MTKTYKVIRYNFNGDKRTIKSGLTLKEAQQHCRDPETSWKTAKSDEASQTTREIGPWFDGYVEDE